jgi:uncharacterized FlaG/YvyC family protein
MVESETIGSIGTVGSANAALADAGARAAPAAVAQPAAQQPSAQDIQNAVNQVNNNLSDTNRTLELSVDAASGLTVATIRNSQTGAVLEQFPSTDSLHLAQMLADWAGSKNALLDLIA